MQETQDSWVQPPGWEDSPGEGNGNPLQFSCLESPMDGGAWPATVHRVAESDMTELACMSCLVLEVLHARKPLNPGYAGTVGHPD